MPSVRPIRARRLRLVGTTAALLVLLVAANIHQLGQAAGGFYDWRCSGCGAGLYCCPGKRLNLLSVPDTYQVHAHAWTTLRRPPSWSAWKLWQWLVLLTSDAEVLREPQPEEVFPAAAVNGRDSTDAGIRVLASDPHYKGRVEWTSQQTEPG